MPETTIHKKASMNPPRPRLEDLRWRYLWERSGGGTDFQTFRQMQLKAARVIRRRLRRKLRRLPSVERYHLTKQLRQRYRPRVLPVAKTVKAMSGREYRRWRRERAKNRLILRRLAEAARSANVDQLDARPMPGVAG